MRLIGILCWFEEAPSWLAATVSSLIHVAGIDHLVAVDGAYALLPEGRAHSGSEQHDAIREVCQATGCGLTVHAPAEPWAGCEVEKRSFAFQLAEQVATVGEDWYFVVDADEVVTFAPDLRELLAAADEEVGTVWLNERFDPHASPHNEQVAQRTYWPRESRQPSNRLFRAAPRLRAVDNHYTYMVGNGRVLIVGNREAAVDTHVEMEHRTGLRDLARREQQKRYYARRDELGIETPTVEAVA